MTLTTTRITHTSTRIGLCAGAAAAAALLIAAPASAHVTVTPSGTFAGSYSVLTFSVPHGCDGSATTSIAVQVPETITEVTPTRNAFYDISVKKERLDPPVTGEDGSQITERDAQVVYTAKTPLPDGERDTFELSVQLPDAAGEALNFPTVQTCVKGETAWTEVAAAGQDPHDLDHPAPSLTITSADASTEHSTEAAADESALAASSSNDDSGRGWGIAGLVAGMIGLLAGVGALLRSGKRA